MMAAVNVANDAPAPAEKAPAKASAKRKFPNKTDPAKADVGPKHHVPTGTMLTVLRHVTTQVSLRGFRYLIDNCPVATCPLHDVTHRPRLAALHAMMCLYDLHAKIGFESSRMWHESSLANCKSYRAIDRIVAAAIEAFSAWKHPRGYYVYVDQSTAYAQIDALRQHYWPIAFPGTEVSPNSANFGSEFFTAFSDMESSIQRGLGKDALRIPSESPDFSILHVGVLKFSANSFAVCGYSEVSHQSEILARVLRLRRYQREGVGYAYIAASESDLDSVHLTSGFSCGRAWDTAEAMFQLKLAISGGSNRVV